jgi:hypothetical protein
MKKIIYYLLGLIIILLVLFLLWFFGLGNISNKSNSNITTNDMGAGIVDKGLYYYLGNNVKSTDLSACQSSTNRLKSTNFFVDYKNSQYSSLVADARLLYDVVYSKEKKSYGYSFGKNEIKRITINDYGCFDRGLMELYIKSNNTLLFKTEIK